MTDASKIVTITSLVDPIQKETDGDIKVGKMQHFQFQLLKESTSKVFPIQ